MEEIYDESDALQKKKSKDFKEVINKKELDSFELDELMMEV